ncbi:MAG: hypothetical protein JW908_02370 [Anaerolineales bacterium]|nr:hypothetical protein [Anaerolineales bacterium]
MKTHKWLIVNRTVILVVVLILALAGGLAQAQEPQPEGGVQPQDESEVMAPEAELNDVIPIQGKLTDDDGNPLNGYYSIRFRIYDVSSGGTALCEDTDSVRVTNGLFNAEMDFCTNEDIFGQQLYLGIKVGSDDEMTPRQDIFAVPYAWSLRPGARIVNTSTDTGAYALFGESQQADGKGLYGLASSSTTTGRPIGTFGQAGALQGIGVFGYVTSAASSGYGGYFVNASSSGDLIAANDALSFTDIEFRVSNNGDVYADGTFNPGGADFAEMLPAVEGLAPGDVLVIGSDGQLTLSTEAYQTSVVGVYSTKPGILGGSEDGKVLSEMDLSEQAPLAVMGVVPVKASAENGAIHPGDLLVTASTPGYAMLAGSNPPQGTVLGKALGGLAEGTGVIKILVMLQ